MKYPLTSEGVSAFQQHLQTFNSLALTKEAETIRSNFKNWVSLNFELSEKQVLFLDQLNNDFIALSAGQMAFAVQNKLSFKLIKPTDSNKLTGSKMIREESSLVAQTSASGQLSAKGEIIFEIIYE